jgi:hypothetical protein
MYAARKRKLKQLAAFALLFTCAGMLEANSGPSAQQASQLIAQAVSWSKFEGVPVDDVLLSEPEKKDGTYRYRAEFNVTKSGKKISCEDWSFVLGYRKGSWGVMEIVRGRCND